MKGGLQQMEYKKNEIIEYLNKLDNLISLYRELALERLDQGNYLLQYYYEGKLTALQNVKFDITEMLCNQ